MREIKIIFLTLFAAILLATPFTVEAKGSNVTVIDEADLLTSAEEEDLYDYLYTLDDGINYLVVTSDDYNTNTDSTLERYYSSYYVESSDGVAFIIDMYNREIYISGYGSVKNTLTSADALDITDNVYTYASYGNYYDCILNAFEQADIVVNKGFILRPMRFIVAFLVSIILGFLGVFIWAMMERRHVVISDSAAQIIVTGMAVSGLPVVYDRVKRPRSNGSGGGGGFSGGGGGGFSGGGGGGHSGGGHSF